MTMWNQMADTHVVAYLNGVATDITRYVLVPPRGGQINSARGRQTELAQMDPSRMSLVLENRDGRFTPGNPSSPYYPYWRQGVRMVWTETLGARTFTHFDGPLEIPEVQLNYQAADPTVNDALLTVSAVDTLTRLDRARPFVSTLDEYIKYNGGSALIAHWPMSDAAGAISAASLVTGVGPLLQVTNYNDAPGNNQLLWSNRAGPRGDDASYVQMDPTASVIANNYQGRPRLARRDISVPMTAGTVVAYLFWIYVPVDATQPLGAGQILVSHANNFLNPTVSVRADIGTGWSFLYNDDLHVGATATVPAVKTDAWSLVGAFLDVDSATMTLRVDSQTATASLGAPALTGTSQEIALDGFAGYSFGPVQIYSGSASQLNQAFFTAQYQMGLLGLERQTTGDRIRTIAQYAGVSASALDRIDDGSTVMQRASLAGKTPLAAMQEAADAERGRLFSAGDGSIVFHDRHRIYNT